MAISLDETLIALGFEFFSGALIMIVLFGPMSIHLSSQASLGLAPVSLTSWRKVLTLLGKAPIS